MGIEYKNIVIVLGLVALAGCSSAPTPQAYANHFSSARNDAAHSKCMTDNTPFNNRQLMMAPNTVENAWAFCARQSDVRYPGKNDAKTAKVSWDKQ